MMAAARGAFVGVVLLTSLVACGGGGGDSEAADTDRCEEVPDALLDKIASEPKGPPIMPVEGAAVLSEDFEQDVYFIAMSFDAPGGDTETGVWATTEIGDGKETGPIFAVDGFAEEFTRWRPASEKGIEYPTDDGIEEAQGCLEG